MPVSPCPLCGKSDKMHKANPLYGTPVCKRCYYAFTSRRQFAYIFDILLWWLAIMMLNIVLISVIEVLAIDEFAAGLVLLTLGWIVYPLIFTMKDGFQGHSPGKYLCGVIVVDQHTHEPISFAQSLKRNLVLMIPVVPLIVGFTLSKGPRLCDKWANTRVVWKKYRNHSVFAGQLACENCQYDLTGNVSGACPECGTPLSESNRQRLAATEPAPPLPAAATAGR